MWNAKRKKSFKNSATILDIYTLIAPPTSALLKAKRDELISTNIEACLPVVVLRI